MPSVFLVPVIPVDDKLLSSVVNPLSMIFGIPVIIDNTNHLDPAFAFDFSRNQYNSTALIAALVTLQVRQTRSATSASSSDKVLGITSVDLFVPVLTFVFGEAQLDGNTAIVSTYRLDESIYGFPPNPRLTQERLLKESLHELGHTFGLIHCPDYLCVMHSSTSVEEIDVKTARFCLKCQEILEKKLA